MTQAVIAASRLGKKYFISHRPVDRYLALRDALAESVRGVRRLLSGSLGMKPSCEEFWALRDVTFEVARGDRLGIIGRNGAGKSTLLKLLSRITEPSTGRITIRGRVASLLEIGTGFHPELTGRENIFLNGAILGMSKAEIKNRFDEIVAFAEVDRFLDTPIKRYSSGMHVRLAFAVAAHLEPEILIVDEVLAVGDAEFQKRCLSKMKEVGRGGGTLIFVSHNMNAVEQLCSSAMLLERGSIKKFSNNVTEIVKDYLFGSGVGNSNSRWINSGHEFENVWFKPMEFRIIDENARMAEMPLRNDAHYWVELTGIVSQTDSALTVGYAIYNEEGHLLYWSYQTDEAEEHWPRLAKGRVALRSRIPAKLLNEGHYRLEVIGGLHYRQWLFQPGGNTPSIVIEIRGGLSESPHWMTRRPGILAPVLPWEAVDISPSFVKP